MEMHNNAEQSRTTGFQLFEHPWAALVVLVVVWVLLLLLLIATIYQVLALPRDSGAAGLMLMILSHSLMLFVIVPYVLRLPNGRRSLGRYLADIRLSRVRPLGRLLLLAISCYLILAFCQAAGSLVYRLSLGLPITWEFVWLRVLDVSRDLPPRSTALLVSVPAVFEEVTWRGVVLRLFLRRHSAWKAIVISAIAFGCVHFLNFLSGREMAWVAGQVAWASIYGLFYGYLVVRTGSLLPAMIVHYLGNAFMGSLTGYVQELASPEIQAVYGVVFWFGLIPTTLLILWVRLFAAKSPFPRRD